MDTLVWYLGRLLFGGFFLYNAYNHFTNLGAFTQYTQSKGIPWPKEAVLASGVLLAMGGICVLFNVYLTIGLIALVLFLVPVTFVVHAFWKVRDPMGRMNERIQFSKNIALLGAVLILFAPRAM